jgi:excinuclease ABC subunit A
MTEKIVIKGAREHNLKNLDLEIPRDRMVVITGISGSGKSTLAFDTIYAEGQRRYVESLSAYARQFLEQMDKPDVESIDGLSPAISIEQKTTSRNPRSTVGTVTEIYDYLRLLFARVGTPHCPECGKPITSQTVQQMVDHILNLPEGAKIQVLSPIVRGRKGEYRKEFRDLQKQGYVRVRIDGELRDLASDIVLDKNKKHDIEVVVDRLVVKDDVRRRLTDSVETALRLADGMLMVDVQGEKPQLFSEKFACIDCGISLPELTPRMFSFNNPYGACEQCAGLGVQMHIDPGLVVPDTNLSLEDGAIAPWERKMGGYFFGMIANVADHYKQPLDKPWKSLPKKFRDIVLYGSGEDEIKFSFEGDNSQYTFKKAFEGVIPNLERRYRETDSMTMREELQRFMSQQTCPACEGTRLRKETLNVRIAGLNISELTHKSVEEALAFFQGLVLSKRDAEIAKRIVKEIHDRLQFLADVGLTYLALDRSSATLSGGEGQRIRLATQIGSRLVGVLYILDEPSIGLHQRDNAKLIETLKSLRDLGNTILVVEHDEDTIRDADYVIDMGPGAGRHGGEIVSAGTPKQIMADKKSLTGQYLSGVKAIEVPKKRRKSDGRWLAIEGATEHNLRDVSAKIPVGLFTCITGVSGSGKSTLTIDTVYRALAQKLNGSSEPVGAHKGIQGLEFFDKVIDIDQSPIGRTPRSNPATYTGLFGDIRELFANVPDARARGYKAGRFSFNVKGGRCEACGGDGTLKIEMHFLPDVYVQCDTCRGQRYNRETLEVLYKGRNIAQVLDMTVDEALEFFAPVPSLRTKLETIAEVGLGYVQLGQAATTLSGGEAQRMKLSRELSKRATGRTIYILDEPTTGLHFEDIRRLLAVLNRLVENGNTVVVIEHNLDVIKTADWLIDLGPEGGSGGGKIIAEGTPEAVAKVAASHTGKFLKRML